MEDGELSLRVPAKREVRPRPDNLAAAHGKRRHRNFKVFEAETCEGGERLIFSCHLRAEILHMQPRGGAQGKRFLFRQGKVEADIFDKGLAQGEVRVTPTLQGRPKALQLETGSADLRP